MPHDPRAIRFVERHPTAALVIGMLAAALPWVLIALAICIVWVMAGAVFSITLGQLVLWAVIFAAGYALGSSR